MKAINAEEARKLSQMSGDSLISTVKEIRDNVYVAINFAIEKGATETGVSFIKYANYPYGEELIDAVAGFLYKDGYSIIRDKWNLNIIWGARGPFTSVRKEIEKAWKEE